MYTFCCFKQNGNCHWRNRVFVFNFTRFKSSLWSSVSQLWLWNTMKKSHIHAVVALPTPSDSGWTGLEQRCGPNITCSIRMNLRRPQNPRHTLNLTLRITKTCKKLHWRSVPRRAGTHEFKWSRITNHIWIHLESYKRVKSRVLQSSFIHTSKCRIEDWVFCCEEAVILPPIRLLSQQGSGDITEVLRFSIFLHCMVTGCTWNNSLSRTDIKNNFEKRKIASKVDPSDIYLYKVLIWSFTESSFHLNDIAWWKTQIEKETSVSSYTVDWLLYCSCKISLKTIIEMTRNSKHCMDGRWQLLYNLHSQPSLSALLHFCCFYVKAQRWKKHWGENNFEPVIPKTHWKMRVVTMLRRWTRFRKTQKNKSPGFNNVTWNDAERCTYEIISSDTTLRGISTSFAAQAFD